MMSTSGTIKNFGPINAVLLLLVVHRATGYSFNPWNWRNPGPVVSPEPTMDPAFNPFLRAPYQPCSAGTKGIMKKVEVTPCDSTDRCPLVRGTNITLHLEFIPEFPARIVVGSLFGVLNSPIPLPAIKFGKPENLCTSNQVVCPVEAGKLYVYSTTVYVKPSYPRLKLDTKVLIQGDDIDIACALIPVVIENPST